MPGADELFFRPSGTEDEQASKAEPSPRAPEQKRRDLGGSGTRRAPKPSGRQRHDEKITVYISGPELLALEQTRLTLRAEYGITADRGRLVREAVAVLLADFEEHGPASTLVRRLGED
nr:hypothetical protein [Nocardiopsis algeriensis]